MTSSSAAADRRAAAVQKRAGGRVAVIDAAVFPRVKLCAGWVSDPIWDALELAPADYPGALWEWRRCHVHYRGRRHTFGAHGWFIRRAELDHFLLRRCRAEVVQGHRVRAIERDSSGHWIVDDAWRAPLLGGAGGTSCPVARGLFARRADPPAGTQELELRTDPVALAACRSGEDGEPELLLHDDLGGYSWAVPKTDWLNVGCGRARAKEVRAAWRGALAHFEAGEHLPAEARRELDRARGWSYHLFVPNRRAALADQGAFLVGDALGLAHPLPAEGILPAVRSGRICAQALLDGAGRSYQRRLRADPLFVDYALVRDLQRAGGRLRGGARVRAGVRAAWLDRAVARVFVWLFSGKSLPGGRALRSLVGGGPSGAQSSDSQ